MEFTLDSEEYEVAEFYETFYQQFPMLVMVTVGYCSELMLETFDKGQGLRIHTYSKQKRVVAKQTERGEENLFSIPLDYPIKFHVSKKNVRKGKEKSLREILDTQSLPTVVQFAKGHEFHMGSRKVSTDSLPALTLIDTFEETYLLCNTLVDGSLDHRPMPIPLYLKYVRLSRIIGFKNQSQKEFDKYVKQLDDQSTQLIHDPTYGNEDIAVYNPNDIHSCSQYAYIQPNAYSDISILYENRDFDKNIYENRDTEMNTYDYVGETHSEIPKVEQTDFKIVDWTGNTEVQPSSATEGNFVDLLTIALQKRTSKSETSEPPLVQPKPTTLTSKKSHEPPPIPPRRKPSIPQNDQGTTLKGGNLSALKSVVSFKPEREAQSGLYEDLLDNVQDPCLTPSKTVSSNQLAAEATVGFHADVVPPNLAYSNVVIQKEPSYGHVTGIQKMTSQLPACKVSEMTIEQIGQCLKWLGLSHYVDTFKENGVDGVILQEFDEQLLAEDFGFKKLEVIKLMQFVRRGHIPK